MSLDEQKGLEHFDELVAQIMQKMEDPTWWEANRNPEYNCVCPECFASVPLNHRTDHTAWHRSQYAQLRSLLSAMVAIGDAGKTIEEALT